MVRKDNVSLRLPVRRGLSECEAAVYIIISPSFFRRLVEDGRMPRPRLAGSRRIWDVDELDAAFRDLPREGKDGQPVQEVATGNSWSDYE